jgi:hypothetical protein
VTMLGEETLAPQRAVKSCAERAKAPKPAPGKPVRSAKRKT